MARKKKTVTPELPKSITEPDTIITDNVDNAIDDFVTSSEVELINAIRRARGSKKYELAVPRFDAWRLLGLPIVIDETVEPGTVVVKTSDGKRTVIKWL